MRRFSRALAHTRAARPRAHFRVADRSRAAVDRDVARLRAARDDAARARQVAADGREPSRAHDDDGHPLPKLLLVSDEGETMRGPSALRACGR